MITIEGQLTEADHKSHVPLSFDVPTGVSRLSARFTATPTRATGAMFDNLISLSLWGPAGPRGARHNNPQADFQVEATWATPGYLPGPIEPGRWTIWLDTFRLLGPDPVEYRLDIGFATGPIPPAAPFVPRQTRPRGPGWYRGDLHAHTLHSDGSWKVSDLVAWARDRGLDFMTLSDHNTTSGHAELHSRASDDLLTLGGMEMTTHWGHALSLGPRWQEWRTGPVTGLTMPELAQAVMAADQLFVIAHPMSPGDPSCTGCRWEYHDMRPGPARLVEIWNGGPWSDYNEDGLALYREWLGQGHRLHATAGSDIHGPEGGKGPIGFNNVEADALTPQAIFAAVAAGRNYLSSGPRLILTATSPMGRVVPMGGTVPSDAVFHADLQSEAAPLMLLLVDGSGVRSRQPVAAGSAFAAELKGAEDYVMAELRDAAGTLHAVTNPIFVG
jgi:hypothetical protein